MMTTHNREGRGVQQRENAPSGLQRAGRRGERTTSKSGEGKQGEG